MGFQFDRKLKHNIPTKTYKNYKFEEANLVCFAVFFNGFSELQNSVLSPLSLSGCINDKIGKLSVQFERNWTRHVRIALRKPC